MYFGGIDPDNRLERALCHTQIAAGRFQFTPGLVHIHLHEQAFSFVDHAVGFQLQCILVMLLERPERLFPYIDHPLSQPDCEITLHQHGLHGGIDLPPVLFGDRDHRPGDSSGIDTCRPRKWATSDWRRWSKHSAVRAGNVANNCLFYRGSMRSVGRRAKPNG